MTPREILLVDDDSENRDVLAQVLQAHGYTVRQAENGRIALDMIAERVPGILLLDLEMPVMSGWEVLTSLQRSGALKVIAVVVLSAIASPPLGVAFMRKPCGIDDLIRMLAGVGGPRGADAWPARGDPRSPPRR
ncbi:MAG TPA: response regulator [Anaeromyxobacteraceae bacterium]|nr:response regulator [Anaeromyxobacteraceae bacterium]